MGTLSWPSPVIEMTPFGHTLRFVRLVRRTGVGLTTRGSSPWTQYRLTRHRRRRSRRLRPALFGCTWALGARTRRSTSLARGAVTTNWLSKTNLRGLTPNGMRSPAPAADLSIRCKSRSVLFLREAPDRHVRR